VVTRLSASQNKASAAGPNMGAVTRLAPHSPVSWAVWGARTRARAEAEAAAIGINKPARPAEAGGKTLPDDVAAVPRALKLAAMSDLAIADLARSGILPKQAEILGMYSAENARTETGYNEFRPEPALVIPYYQPNGEPMTFERYGEVLQFCRVRFLGPPAQKLGFSGPKTADRYSQPARSGARVYFPRCVPWTKTAADPEASILIVEGEKKAAVAALLGYNSLGIGGCWNFRHDGALAGIKDLLPELEPLISRGRTVILALDGDAATNTSVAAAECRLALELGTLRGASVYRVRFPVGDDGQRLGLDDYALKFGEAALEKLLAGAEKMCAADAAVAELNMDNAIVCQGGRTFVAQFGRDDVRKCQQIDFFEQRAFEMRLANRTTVSPSTGKPAPLAKVWLAHPSRRQYLDGVTFAPLRDVPESKLNLWRGFSVEPVAGDWALFRTHILENICSGNALWCDYILNWLARLVQMPGEAGQVAIALRGKKGTGKGKFAYWIGRLIRDHFFQATQSEHVTGKFNSHLLTTVLLFADEALFAGDPRNEKILNGLITEETRTSEQKFMPAITVQNYLHLIMATNSNWAVPATEDERRYFVLDVSDLHMQDSPYFAAIDMQMGRGGAEAMLFDLQARDISKFQVRSIPRTEALADQQVQTAHGRGDVSGWVYDFLSAGEIKGARAEDPAYRWAKGELEISKNEARRLYDEWARQRGRRPIDPALFGRDMRVGLGDALRETRRRTPLGRSENYVLRPLEECRIAYQTAFAAPSLWSETDG
jgi:hypothetical protein